METVSIIGSGSFGCSLSYLISKNNYNIKIWSYKDEECDLINKKHECMYLNDFKLDERIKCFRSYEEAIKDSKYIILVTPSSAIRETCKNIKEYISNQDIILASKGLEGDKLLSEVVKEELNITPTVILGPSHAEQIIKDIPTYIEYSGNKEINKLFENDNFKMFYNEDLIGLQIGSSIKNIIAICMGIIDGLGYELDTAAYIITEGLKEMQEIGVKFGGKKDTFYGLSGLGDLIATSLSMDSRNKKAGIMLSKGYKLDQIKEELQTIEGLSALNNVIKIIKEDNINCPLINNLYEIIYNNKNVKNILSFE